MKILALVPMIVLLLPGCVPAAPQRVVPPEKQKVPFKPDVERVPEVKGISIEASAKENVVETLRSVIGNNGELTWNSTDGKPHVIDANGTQITLTTGTRIRFEFGEKNGLFSFETPRPNVSVKTGPFRLNAPAASVLFKPDNSADATVDVGFGIKKTKSFKVTWDSESQGASQDTAATENAAVKRPIVWCYTTPGCGPCEQAKRELAGQELPYDVKFTDEHPNWVTMFPTFHWNDVNEKGRKQVGWPGVRVLTQLVMKSQQSALSSVAPERALPQWSYSGGDSKPALIEHLMSDGIHKGKFSRDYLNRLSKDALVQLHSDDHNGVARN